MTVKDDMANKLEQIKRLREEYKELSQNLFAEGVKAIFDTYPDLIAVGWSQYTPYWNDGDPCEFSVHESQIQWKGVTDQDDFEDEDYGDEWLHDLNGYEYQQKMHNKYPKEKYYIMKDENEVQMHKAVDDVNAILREIDESTMEEMFGDHVFVTVTKEGVTTEGYDHD